MSRRLVAGVDCSTQATKVLVLDADSGEVVASGRRTHTVTGTDGARETDPQQWWTALQGALADTGVAGQVQAIAIGGQQHGLVALGADGQPLRPALLWNDTRSANDADELRRSLGGSTWWAEQVGVVPVASFTVAKWAWLRRTEPHIAAATTALRLPHDHVTGLLTGRGVTDRGDASGTGWWSSATGEYDAVVLDHVGLAAAQLPEVLGPKDVAGEVTTAAAGLTGLPPGAVVAAGSGDNMAAALGLGVAPGTPVVSLGTSGTAYAVSTVRTVDPSGVVAGFADATGHHLPLACTLNCTLAVDRLAALLGLDRDDVAPSAACVVLPYLDGERTPNLPAAAGSVVGLRHATTPQQILRAAYEGAVEALMTALHSIEQTGGDLDRDAPLVLTGGGSRGAAWRDVVGSLSGRALLIPAQVELVAVGAAVQATAALTGEELVAVAQRWDTTEGEVVPARPLDTERIARIRAVRELLEPLNHG